MVVVDESVEIAERASSFVDVGDTHTPVTTTAELCTCTDYIDNK